MGFAPLGNLLLFSCNHWVDAVRNIWRVFINIVVGIFVMLSIPSLVYVILLNTTNENTSWIMFFNPKAATIPPLILTWGVFAVTILLQIYLFYAFVYAKIKAIRVAKQTFISGEFTYQILKDALNLLPSDEDILACLEEEALEFRH